MFAILRLHETCFAWALPRRLSKAPEAAYLKGFRAYGPKKKRGPRGTVPPVGPRKSPSRVQSRPAQPVPTARPAPATVIPF